MIRIFIEISKNEIFRRPAPVTDDEEDEENKSEDEENTNKKKARTTTVAKPKAKPSKTVLENYPSTRQK